MISDHQVIDHHTPAFNVRFVTGFRPDGFDVIVVGCFRDDRFVVGSMFIISHQDTYSMTTLEKRGSHFLLPQDEAVEVAALEQAIHKHWVARR
jgi:hypothetical protein